MLKPWRREVYAVVLCLKPHIDRIDHINHINRIDHIDHIDHI